ncbi:MAG: hypothetical protein ACI8UZ_000190 [Akkermansiaceae bacterium]
MFIDVDAAACDYFTAMILKTRTTFSAPAILVGALFALAGSVQAENAGPDKVELGAADHFVILSKTGITNVPKSVVTGHVGTSPITGAALHLAATEVTGKFYTVDAASSNPDAVVASTKLSEGVLDMETAYTDAAGRVNPDSTEHLAGSITGSTFTPGLHKWGTGVNIAGEVTFDGDADDVWILQVAGPLTVGSGSEITLTGGALAKNIFWQVADTVTIGTTTKFQGIILAKTLIAMQTGASLNGRLFAQTEVTLQMNTVTQPAE